MNFSLEIVKKPTGFLKIAEVVLIICIIAVRAAAGSNNILLPFTGDVDSNTFGMGTVFAFLIITPVLLVMYLMKEVGIQKTPLELVFNIIGAIFFVATGAVTIDFWEQFSISNEIINRDSALAIGSLCIINGAIYLVDSYFAFKNYRQ